MRTIIIGDIHGCQEPLERLLEKVKLDPNRDRLIFLGDLMDRGDQSWEVFDRVRRLKLAMGDRCVLIKGNHEQMMLEAQEDRMMMNLWYSNGGAKTVSSFRKHQDDVWNHRQWFEQMGLYYETEQYICVHGGVEDQGPKATSEDTFLWDRSILEGNYKGKLVIAGHTPMAAPVYLDGWGKTLRLRERRRYRRPRAGYICLDTGCVFGYRLTALVEEAGRYRIVNSTGRES